MGSRYDVYPVMELGMERRLPLRASYIFCFLLLDFCLSRSTQAPRQVRKAEGGDRSGLGEPFTIRFRVVCLFSARGYAYLLLVDSLVSRQNLSLSSTAAITCFLAGDFSVFHQRTHLSQHTCPIIALESQEVGTRGSAPGGWHQWG
jgi:hypothetical protein